MESPERLGTGTPTWVGRPDVSVPGQTFPPSPTAGRSPPAQWTICHPGDRVRLSVSPGFATMAFAGSIGIASAAAVLVQVTNMDDPRVARIAGPAATEIWTFGTTTGPGGDGQTGGGSTNSDESAEAAAGSGEGGEDGEGDATTLAAEGDGATEGDVPALAVQAAADNISAPNANESLERLFRADLARAGIATPHARQPPT